MTCPVGAAASARGGGGRGMQRRRADVLQGAAGKAGGILGNNIFLQRGGQVASAWGCARRMYPERRSGRDDAAEYAAKGTQNMALQENCNVALNLRSLVCISTERGSRQCAVAWEGSCMSWMPLSKSTRHCICPAGRRSFARGHGRRNCNG